MHLKSIYLELLIALGGIIVGSESVQSPDPGPELYPVLPGTNWILCTPLLGEKKVAQAGWSIWLRDEWSWIAGIGRPAENTTTSWNYLVSKRYGFYGSNFLEIRNLTKEDNGSIYRCRIVTWDGHPKSIYFKLHVLELPKEAPSTITSAPAPAPAPAPASTTPAPPTTTPQPPDHDRDEDVNCECTGWIIWFVFSCVLLIAFAVGVTVWRIRYRRADNAGRVESGSEVVGVTNESNLFVVNERNGIENGKINYGEKCGSRETVHDDGDAGSYAKK